MRRWVALLGAAAALGACERAPGEAAPPFPSDGASGFGGASLVDVCIGAARTSADGASAVCVPEGAEAPACGADEDCAGAERCQCGRCVVRVCGPGSVCPQGEACRGGRCAKSCTESAECGAGEICNGGGCTRECGGDGDCGSGEVCDFFGVCAAQACDDASPCGSGYTCEPLVVDGDLREPSIVTVDGEDLLFFELRSKGGSAVYRARFDGPLHVTADPETPVLEAPMGRARVGAPSAVASGARVDLFVEVEGGESIGLARSLDAGVTFTWLSEALLVPEEAWEGGYVGSPGAFERGGATYVFYEAGPGSGIGLTRMDGEGLSRMSKVPVAVPSSLEDASFWRAVQSIGSPWALVSGGVVRLYVSARGVDAGVAMTQGGPVQPRLNDSIGMFATTDLATFSRYPTGPVLATLSGLYGSLDEREPAVRVTEDGADLYFVAPGAQGAQPPVLERASTVR